METLSVRCNHCGAPLEVGEQTRFVTCKFCQSQLEVKKTESSAFTEVVQQIAENTNRMSDNLKVIELQNELERLDREWDMNKEQFYVKGKSGVPTRPSSPAGAIIAGFVAVVFVLFMVGSAVDAGAPAIFPVFGLVFIGFIIFGITSGLNKGMNLNRAESDYQQERAKIMSAIDGVRRERDA